MIGRRAVLVAGAAIAGVCPAQAALPIPAGDSLAFRLMRRGAAIGQHTLAFEQSGNTLTVTIAVEARVTLLSIPIVHYTHHVVETWQEGRLSAVTGQTDKNGRTEWVNAHRTAEGLVVQGSRTARYVAPDGAIGTSYWNKQMLDGPMISFEDGVLLRPKVTDLGSQPVPLADGATVAASHYNLSGSFNVDVFYDRTSTWAGLSFTVADGSTIQYQRL